MEQWLINNILAFGLAFVLTSILIPQILLIAFRKNLFDGHDERKNHTGDVPRLGGFAFVPSIIFAVLAVASVGLMVCNIDMLQALDSAMVPLFFLICALMLLFLVGIADDLIGARYGIKFFFQILSGILMIASGIWIWDLYGLLGLTELSPWIGWPLTVLAVTYVVNAINLIDGIDGLAAGLVAMALVFYGTILFYGGAYVYSMVAWAGVGTLLPFLYYNIFGKAKSGKKIFMGDTGSLTMGMIVVFLAIVLMIYPFDFDGKLEANPFVLAVAPMIIPLFDVVRVFFRRVRLGRNPFLPDRTHIHHKLLDLGLSSSAVLCVLLGSAVIFMVSNVILSVYLNINIIIGGDIVVWTLGNYWLTRAIRHREKKIGMKLYK